MDRGRRPQRPGRGHVLQCGSPWGRRPHYHVVLWHVPELRRCCNSGAEAAGRACGRRASGLLGARVRLHEGGVVEVRSRATIWAQRSRSEPVGLLMSRRQSLRNAGKFHTTTAYHPETRSSAATSGDGAPPGTSAIWSIRRPVLGDADGRGRLRLLLRAAIRSPAWSGGSWSAGGRTGSLPFRLFRARSGQAALEAGAAACPTRAARGSSGSWASWPAAERPRGGAGPAALTPASGSAPTTRVPASRAAAGAPRPRRGRARRGRRRARACRGCRRTAGCRRRRAGRRGQASAHSPISASARPIPKWRHEQQVGIDLGTMEVHERSAPGR